MSAPRIAVNPIQYWAKAGRSKAVLDVAFAELSAIGYTAVKADVPDELAPADYLDWLAGFNGIKVYASLGGTEIPVVPVNNEERVTIGDGKRCTLKLANGAEVIRHDVEWIDCLGDFVAISSASHKGEEFPPRWIKEIVYAA